MAQYLNITFYNFDKLAFWIMHDLAQTSGEFFTPFFKIISLMGEKGLIFFVSAAIMMLFAKTRKLGICMFCAVACGAILTNLVLKDIIARPRPFKFLTSDLYNSYWHYVGSPAEDGYSFPSGHMTAIMAAMTAMFILCNKKWSWVGFIEVLLMGASRVYLIAHYASDVLAGIIVGAVAGVIAFLITKIIYSLFNKYSSSKFCNFCLHWSIIKKKNKETNESIIEEEE